MLWVDRTADQGRLDVRHRSGPPTDQTLSDSVLSVLTAYLGVYFGRAFSADDEKELTERMKFAAARDGGWSREYVAAADLLEKRARSAGAPGYLAAPPDIQLRIVRELRLPPQGVLSDVRLGLSEKAMAQERMRVSTARHLIRLYRQSGVPWRHRGYETWPGAPDTVPAVDRLMPV